MAVNLTEPGVLLPVKGIRLSACSAGLYGIHRDDFALISVDEGSTGAAVFTKNHFCAAPVKVARNHLAAAPPRFCLINAGNANAGTGEQGVRDSIKICRALAETADVPLSSVLPFSTGVIGEYLPVDRLSGKIQELYSGLAEDKWLQAARAIMTTDTIAKGASRRVVIADREVTVTGIAKGSGMIRPDMATMLVFITTDMKVEQNFLKQLLARAVEKSFHRISVDGDTSTNDACVLISTGKSGCEINDDADVNAAFEQAVTEVCLELAQSVVRDGEGATKFITVDVAGGLDSNECLGVAYTIAHSPLIKTAFYASDPNWGRILAAVGRSGIPDLDIMGVSIYLSETCIVENGVRAAAYTEEAGRAAMDSDEIKLRVELGRGNASETLWTCDLSHEYVRINAEYRT